MKMNQLKTGSILSYFNMFLNIAISLLYTPFMLGILGQSEYGLYSTVSATISMLGVLNLGFTGSYVRYFMKYKVDNYEDSMAKLNGLFLIIFSGIGAIALACGLFLSNNLEMVFNTGLTASEYETAKKLMIILSFNMAISFPMSVFQNIITAHEKYLFLKLLGIIKTIAGPMITIPLLLSGFGSVAMVTTTVILALVTDIVYFIYSKKFLGVKFRFRRFPEGLFKSVFTFSFLIAVHLIVDQINSNVDKVLLGRFLGTDAVAIYAVGYSLHHYYMLFSTAISHVFTPRVHKIINETKNHIALQKERLTELFVKVGRIQSLVVFLIASGLVFFGKHFIYLWVGEEYHLSYYVAIMLVLSSTIDVIQNIGIEVQRGLNKHGFRSVVYLIMALINIGLTIVLCQKYGVVGATVGTAISYLLVNGLIINIFYHKKCNLDIWVFWKSILRLSAGLIIPCIAGVLINIFMDMSSYIMLIIGILIYTLLYCSSMWFIGMNNYERNLILTPAKKIINKIFKK